VAAGEPEVGRTSPPSVFAGIPEDELTSALGGLPRRIFAPGELLIVENDRPGAVFLIHTGQAEVLVSDRDGVEHVVNRVGPGTLLGEMSLLTGQPASGSVCASTDLEAIVVDGAEFERLLTAFPQIYRNISAVLASRLARANRLAARDVKGRVALLEDRGAPPELAWALACSISWHSRRPTLLLVVDENPSETLTTLAVAADKPSQERATLSIVPSLAALGSGSLNDAIEELFLTYDHIAVLAPAAQAGALRTARHLVLGGPDTPADEAGTVLARAWTYALPRLGPDESGVVNVPPLEDADIEALRAGSLPHATPAGRAIGWLARDFAGLKVGIALGAGSLRGYAHIGVLNYLRWAGLQEDYIAGTSIGAAVATLHAIGYPPHEVADILDRTGPTLFRPTLSRAGLMSNRVLSRFLQEVAGGLVIEHLPLPLALVAADLETRREVVFRTGPVWLAVLASISIPGVYPALKVGAYTLVDGGVLTPVPTNVAAGMGADMVVAVRLSNTSAGAAEVVAALESRGSQPNALSVIMQSIDIMQARIVTDPPQVPTVAITPSLDGMSGSKLRNFAEGRRFIEAGEQAADEALSRIAAIVPWLRR
jgi:NTE family protein